MDLAGEVPKVAAELDQHGCMYTPHVLTAMIGQEIIIKNQDTFLHNVHLLLVGQPAVQLRPADQGRRQESRPVQDS